MCHQEDPHHHKSILGGPLWVGEHWPTNPLITYHICKCDG